MQEIKNYHKKETERLKSGEYGGYFSVPNKIFEIGLNKKELLVYLYLMRCSYNGSVALPSLDDIAAKTGLGRTSVNEAKNNLIERGIIFKQRRKGYGKKNNSNLYKVKFDLTDISKPSTHTELGDSSHGELPKYSMRTRVVRYPYWIKNYYKELYIKSGYIPISETKSKNIISNFNETVNKSNLKKYHAKKPTEENETCSTSEANSFGDKEDHTLKKELNNVILQWNNFEPLIRVIEVSDNLLNRYQKTRQYHSLNEIISAITNYSEILIDDKYILTHKWTLAEFLTKIDYFKSRNLVDEKYLKGEYQNQSYYQGQETYPDLD